MPKSDSHMAEFHKVIFTSLWCEAASEAASTYLLAHSSWCSWISFCQCYCLFINYTHKKNNAMLSAFKSHPLNFFQPIKFSMCQPYLWEVSGTYFINGSSTKTLKKIEQKRCDPGLLIKIIRLEFHAESNRHRKAAVFF